MQVRTEVKACFQEQMEVASQDLVGSSFQMALNWRTPGLLHHQCLHPLVGGGAQWEVLVEYSEVE